MPARAWGSSRSTRAIAVQTTPCGRRTRRCTSTSAHARPVGALAFGGEGDRAADLQQHVRHRAAQALQQFVEHRQALAALAVGFAAAVVADLATHTPALRQRVYATGHSNGGILSHRIAAERSGPPRPPDLQAPDSSYTCEFIVQFDDPSTMVCSGLSSAMRVLVRNRTVQPTNAAWLCASATEGRRTVGSSHEFATGEPHKRLYFRRQKVMFRHWGIDALRSSSFDYVLGHVNADGR